MAKTTRQTKKDLEDKIAELEKKLSNLASQIESKPAPKPKPAETKPTPPPKPAETKPTPPPKPAETKPTPPPPTAKPGALPKGMEKPAETQQTAPEAASDSAPATINQALEHAYQNAAMTDFHQYRAKVTGYTPAANRYFVRRTAPVGTVTTTSWHQQKATVAGYTQPSNQYFATRARLAYHPPEKTFTGYDMKVEGVPAEAQTQSAPPPEPPKQSGTLPKGMEQPAAQQAPPQPETTYASAEGKSRQEQLEDYEKDYLERLEQQRQADVQAAAQAAAAEAQAKASQNRGTLPKGFEPPAPAAEEKPQSRGTLPKGF